jgi:hypothetical protein
MAAPLYARPGRSLVTVDTTFLRVRVRVKLSSTDGVLSKLAGRGGGVKSPVAVGGPGTVTQSIKGGAGDMLHKVEDRLCGAA